MRATRRALLVLLLAAVASAQEAPAPSRATVPKAERVVIVSIDGLRPDLLVQANTPNIRALLREGSYTFWARTIALAYTLPAHASMLTGVTPAKHGILWNERVEKAYPKSPSLFEVAKAAGLTTAMASGKMKFDAFDKPGALDWKYLPPAEPVLDTFVAQRAAEIIRDHRPHVLLVHLPGVDVVGHTIGWGSPEQIAWVGEADKAVGIVLAALKAAGVRDTTLLILTADHGGAGVEHLPGDDRSRHVPWIAVGPGVRKGMDLTRYPDLNVEITDTFATACAAIGITPKGAVEGKAVTEVSEQAPDPPRVAKGAETPTKK